MFGRRWLFPLELENVNPVSVDLTLSPNIRIQRYRGMEFDDALAEIEYDEDQPDSLPKLHFIGSGLITELHGSSTDLCFRPGDSVLATTVEHLYIPRWMRVQGMLKSSVARAGLNHRTALYVDPGFRGQLTLELVFDRSGYLIPDKPIIQIEAQVGFPQHPYNGHYQDQRGAQTNRNTHGIAFYPKFMMDELEKKRKVR